MTPLVAAPGDTNPSDATARAVKVIRKCDPLLACNPAPVAGSRLWNSLSLNLRNSGLALLGFRWLLKTHLFCRRLAAPNSLSFRATCKFTYLLTNVPCT